MSDIIYMYNVNPCTQRRQVSKIKCMFTIKPTWDTQELETLKPEAMNYNVMVYGFMDIITKSMFLIYLFCLFSPAHKPRGLLGHEFYKLDSS